MSHPDEEDPGALVRHEEELDVRSERVQVGAVRARKQVDSERVAQAVDRDVEHADVERVAAAEGDSGQVETLPDGSVSIPILEEELVITKRLVVRERVIVRKRVETEQQVVEADLHRERIEIEGDVEQ